MAQLDPPRGERLLQCGIELGHRRLTLSGNLAVTQPAKVPEELWSQMYRMARGIASQPISIRRRDFPCTQHITVAPRQLRRHVVHALVPETGYTIIEPLRRDHCNVAAP